MVSIINPALTDEGKLMGPWGILSMADIEENVINGDRLVASASPGNFLSIAMSVVAHIAQTSHTRPNSHANAPTTPSLTDRMADRCCPKLSRATFAS